MDLIFYYVTWLGSILVLLPAAVMVVMAFWKTLHLLDNILILGSVVGAALITHVLKILFPRPRPDIMPGMIVNMPADFSFPSAHTAQATAFFLSLAFVITPILPMKSSVAVWAIAGLIIAMVGLSRTYLKVHYFSDVIAGVVVGVFWVYLLIRLLNIFITGRNHA